MSIKLDIKDETHWNFFLDDALTKAPSHAPDWVKKAWVPAPAHHVDFLSAKNIIDCSPKESAIEFVDGPAQGKLYVLVSTPEVVLWGDEGRYELRKESWVFAGYQYVRKFYKFVSVPSLSPEEKIWGKGWDKYKYPVYGQAATFHFDDLDPKAMSILSGKPDDKKESELALWEQI